MTAPVKRRGPLEDREWFGYLCMQNIDEVAERIRRMLDGRSYTFVAVHDGHPGLTHVRTSNRLQEPPKVWRSKDGVAGITCHDGEYVWGVSTEAETERDGHAARESRRYDFVRLSWRVIGRGHEQLTIEQFNGVGEPLQWVIALETER